MANLRIPGPVGTTNRPTKMDTGTLCRGWSPAPGPSGLVDAQPAAFSYSISGTVGALGGMLFTEATNRLPGTWYDRTLKTTQMVANEAALGLSEFFDADAHKAARRTIANLKSPSPVDVDIHFETKDRVENIMVRGKRGSRSFSFDFKKAEEKAESLPEGADPFKPFNETIDKILAAVVQVR